MTEFDPIQGIEEAVAAEVQNGYGDVGIVVLRDSVDVDLDK